MYENINIMNNIRGLDVLGKILTSVILTMVVGPNYDSNLERKRMEKLTKR